MTAIPLDLPRGRVSMGAFRWLVRKELWDHLHGYRFYLGASMVFVLCMLATVVRLSDLRQAHYERNAFLQRWIPSVEEQLERDENVQVENTRGISPLTILSIGLEPVMPFRFTSTKEGLRYGETRSARNAVDALFGFLDISFVVGVLLSLLATALTFDSVCGERVHGTLAMVLSYPVSRSSVLLAKVTGNAAVLLVCFVPSFVLTMAITAFYGAGVESVGHWAAYGAASILYLLSFVAAGTAISAMTRRPADAALLCLFVWVLFVFVVPRVVALTVNQFDPPTRAVELSIKEDEMVSKLRLEYRRKQQQAFQSYLSAGESQSANEDFNRARRESADELSAKRREVVGRLWDEQSRDERSRERLVSVFSILSPTAMFNETAAELAWTGYRQREHFVHESRNYDERIGRKLAESRQAFYGKAQGGRVGALIIKDAIKPYLMPFKGTLVPSRDILPDVVAPILVLITYSALWFLAGYIAIVRITF
jgi:ABC-type transport system involved in multi-copper enzyme maturation, permease component